LDHLIVLERETFKLELLFHINLLAFVRDLAEVKEENMTNPPSDQMAELAISDSAPVNKGKVKRDALRANELAVQAKWEECKAFESDYSEENKEKFIVTFPFPYSNGHLHIGHAFSLTKAVFRAQFERHQGKNVLFPFAFHCTGMPIQAVSY